MLGAMKRILSLLLAFVPLFGGLALPARAQPSAPTISVLWGGDVMLGRGIAEGMARPGNPDPLAPLHQRLAAADLRIANLEGPLTSHARVSANPYDLTASPDRVAVLVAAGFDALSVANNHATDNGRDGLVETLATLREAGIEPIGGGVNAEEAYSPVLLERGGLRLALLAYDVTGAGFPALDDAPGVASFDLAIAGEAIRAARKKADVVVVQLHWGIEYAVEPTANQRSVARSLVAAGADAVIGHHPHVVQPVEWIPRPEGRPALVAYSLGNFVFDSYDEDAKRGALLETTLDAEGVVAVQAFPFYTDWRGVVPLDTPEAQAALEERLFPGPTADVRLAAPDGGEWWEPATASSAAKMPTIVRIFLRPHLRLIR